MIDRISQWLVKVSKGWVALAALVFFLLFTALVLPTQSARPSGDGEDVGSPDLSFFYSSADLYRMAEAYGPDGRAEYVRARYTFDVVWPLVYTFFLLATLGWAAGKAFDPASPWRRVAVLPLLPLVLDYLENLASSVVMLRYPAQTAVVDWLAPVFTAVKWTTLGASFAVLLVCTVIAIGRLVRKKR